MTRKSKTSKKSGSTEGKQTKHNLKGTRPDDKRKTMPHLFKKGQSGNPAGRTKGSRNRFAEAFLNDMEEAWKLNGAEVIHQSMILDPPAFLRVAAQILPKELIINEGQGALDQLIEDMDEDELKDFVTGIRALRVRQNGTTGQQQAEKIKARSKPDSVH